MDFIIKMFQSISVCLYCRINHSKHFFGLNYYKKKKKKTMKK